jgi:hypothetical protein
VILTLCDQEQTLHIDITADQFKRLRTPDISTEDIYAIASDCHIDAAILLHYVADLNTALKELIEIDGSCDYSDHP